MLSSFVRSTCGAAFQNWRKRASKQTSPVQPPLPYFHATLHRCPCFPPTALSDIAIAVTSHRCSGGGWPVIMANAQNTAAQSSSPSTTELPLGSPLDTSLVRHDSTSSDGSHKYSPLKPGRWIVNVHGNCPKCRHHHSAVEVKVKVPRHGEASHVSNIHCEKCNEKWVAFGARNATEISLLSAVTIEPDPLEREVRYRLIDIVRAATAVASLGSIPELAAHDPSRRPSARSPIGDVPQVVDQSPNWTPPLAWANDALTQDLEQHRPYPEQTSPAPSGNTIVVKHRNSVRRLMSRIRTRMRNSMHLLHRDNSDSLRVANTSNQQEMSARQFDKSPVRDAPVAGPMLDTGTKMDPCAHVDKRHFFETVKRNAEVDDFIEGLDTTGLGSVSGHERSSWMRKTFTAFKARKKSSRFQLVMSEIVNVYNDPPRFYHCTAAHRLDDLQYAGTHTEGVVGIESNNARWWRRSMSISERGSEVLTAHDDITVASCPQCSRRGSLQQEGGGSRQQRRLSLPNVQRPFEHLTHLRDGARYSFDSFRQARNARASSTIRGRVSRRQSQASISHVSRSSVRKRSTSQASQSRWLFREVPRCRDQSAPPPAPASQHSQ